MDFDIFDTWHNPDDVAIIKEVHAHLLQAYSGNAECTLQRDYEPQCIAIKQQYSFVKCGASFSIMKGGATVHLLFTKVLCTLATNAKDSSPLPEIQLWGACQLKESSGFVIGQKISIADKVSELIGVRKLVVGNASFDQEYSLTPTKRASKPYLSQTVMDALLNFDIQDMEFEIMGSQFTIASKRFPSIELAEHLLALLFSLQL